MLKKQGGKPTELEFVSVDELVPGDHLLRKVERAVDFSFIRERVASVYCADNGRPTIDPVILFKMLFIGYHRPTHRKGYFYKRDYTYYRKSDHYVCPAGQVLTYSTTNRWGYREYKSDPDLCQYCPLLEQCTQSANHVKVITRHVWERSKERIGKHRLMERGKTLYQHRKETVERSFADAKELHGHRYAKMRGLRKVQEQSLLCAICQNIKKIALIAGGSLKNRLARLLKTLFSAFQLYPCLLPVTIRPLPSPDIP
ncbi:MAG: transposase [bacterium]|nr:transposase [bacterium]